MSSIIRLLPILILLLIVKNSLAQNLIETGDTLRVELKGVPAGDVQKFNGQVLVGAKGTVRIPIVNKNLKAKGLTPEQLARAIEKLFITEEIYTNPTIEVFANQAQGGLKALYVHVGGKVGKNGPVPFREGMTIEQAIMAAGGFDIFGSERNIHLTRDGKTYKIDFKKGNERLTPLKIGDTINVQQTNWRGE